MIDDAVILADTLPIRFADIEIIPELREIRANGRAILAEPKVLQVLVVLLQRGGGVVSRDELARRCWNGRIVGEDALNRTIAKLRHLATAQLSGAFDVQTVRGVGFRIPGHSNGSSATCDNLHSSLHFNGKSPHVSAVLDLETRGLSLVFEGTAETTREGIRYLRHAVDRPAPNPLTLGALAMAYVLSLADEAPDKQDRTALRVRETAERALSIDPTEGRSLAALVSLEPTFGNWTNKETALRAAIALAVPGASPLIFQNVLFLASGGRTREALHLTDELLRTSPLVPWIQSARIHLLWAEGRLEEAERTANNAAAIWPRHRLVWFTRFYLHTYNGNAAKALSMLSAHDDIPLETEAEELAIAGEIAEALADHSPSSAEAVMARLYCLAQAGQGYAQNAVRASCALNRPDDALAFLGAAFSDKIPRGPKCLVLPRIGFTTPMERDTAFLFIPPVSHFIHSPAFAKRLEELGIV